MPRSWLLIVLLFGPLQMTLPSQARPTMADKSGAGMKCGGLADQVFRCPKYGFTIRVPFGWVDRTADMQERPESASDDSSRQGAKASGSQLLLAVFEHPPEVVGETINSAIVIAAENLANYPQMKTSADYFGPISDLARERGFSVESEPYPFLIGGRRLVRGDFKREQGKLTMWQSSLVMIENHSILSFTFIAGSDEEADELIEQLSLLPPKIK